MRNLDSLNIIAKSSKFAFTISLPLPFIMGMIGFGLTHGAAPKVPLINNYLELFSLLLMAFTLILAPVPYIFKWNWETKYFGALIFPITSASIIGFYSILILAQYSSLPVFSRFLIAVAFIVISFRCSWKLVAGYRKIFLDDSIKYYIYEEETDAIYFLQQADMEVSKKLNLNYFPDSKYSLFFFATAIFMTPFASYISNYVGQPFTHVFLAIFSIPLNDMFFAIATKIFLAYIYIPNKIKKELKKPIYVDMSSIPRKKLSLDK